VHVDVDVRTSTTGDREANGKRRPNTGEKRDDHGSSD
jgi:hypothetical protein